MWKNFLFTLGMICTLSLALAQEKKAPPAPEKGKVTASSLNVRSGPGTQEDKIATLSEGDVVTILKEQNGWYEIQMGKGKGWVSAKFIEKISEPSSPKESGKVVSLGKGKKAKDLGLFRITYYWMIHEKNYTGPKDTPIYDSNRKLIGYFSEKFVKALNMEGTAKLNDGRVLNVAGKGKYSFVKAPYGMGVKRYQLQPYHSIAVDPKVIPIGTVIYIHEAKGVKLPDGTVHDGFFYAHDVGGRIKGNHIDIFTGDGDNSHLLSKAGIKSLKNVRLYKVLP